MRKETKKKEALRRLELLEKHGLMPDVRKSFENDNKLFYSERLYYLEKLESDEAFGALYWIDDIPEVVKEKINYVEKQGCVVYHITHEYTNFGELWDLLVITDEDADKVIGETMRQNFDEYGIQFAYVINLSIPEYSEYGSIGIKVSGGGLIRCQ